MAKKHKKSKAAKVDKNNPNPSVPVPPPQQNTDVDYPYYKYIKSPEQLGLSSKGKNIGKNFKGIMAYVAVILSGKSKASATGNPLGNRVFVSTPSKCKDVATNNLVDRYIYFDNIPNGTIQLDFGGSSKPSNTSSGDDAATMEQGSTLTMAGYKGLVPGIMGDIAKINPITLFSELKGATYPSCHQVTLDTVDTNNIPGSATHYVADNDLRWVDPCLFDKNVNVVTKSKCKRPHKHIPPPPPPPPVDPSSDPTASPTTDPSQPMNASPNKISESFDNYKHLYTQLDIFLIVIIIFFSLYVIYKFIRI